MSSAPKMMASCNWQSIGISDSNGRSQHRERQEKKHEETNYFMKTVSTGLVNEGDHSWKYIIAMGEWG